MDERIKKALEGIWRETREGLRRTVGEATQQTFEGMETMRASFMAQQGVTRSIPETHGSNDRIHQETSEEERRGHVKGKGVAAGEGPNVKVPVPTPTQQFPEPQDHPYRTSQTFFLPPATPSIHPSQLDFFPQRPPAIST